MENSKKIINILRYQDLFFIFIWKEISVRYNQAVLGIAWALIQPLSFMLVFTFIFTYVRPIRVSDLPKPVFFYSGLLPWTFFSSSLACAIPSLTNNYNLIRKIYFPKILLPLASIAITLIDLIIASFIFIFLLFFYNISLSGNAFWLAPLFLLLILFTVAFSLFFSALNIYYRDVNLALSTLLRLWFFATPIFYSLDRVPDQYKIIFFLNPLAYIIENMRQCLFTSTPISVNLFLAMLTFGFVAVFLAYKFFEATERKFADVI